MNHAGGQTANGGELLSARHGAFDFTREVMFSPTVMTCVTSPVSSARIGYFADEPVVSVAGLGNRLLLDAVNFAGLEHLAEFVLQESRLCLVSTSKIFWPSTSSARHA